MSGVYVRGCVPLYFNNVSLWCVQETLRESEEDARMRMGDLRMEGGGRAREKVVVEVDESRPGVVADGLRAAAATGVNKSDLGRLEEEGTVHVELRRERK